MPGSPGKHEALLVADDGRFETRETPLNIGGGITADNSLAALCVRDPVDGKLQRLKLFQRRLTKASNSSLSRSKSVTVDSFFKPPLIAD
jgi:hypothetical protein